MKRVLAPTLRLLGLCGLASLWLAQPVQAQNQPQTQNQPQARTQTTPLGRYGAWSVYSMVTPAGRNVCGMVAQGSEGRRLHVQHVRGSNFILFQAFKASWRIPQGTRMAISMRIDEGAAWAAPQATGQRNSMQWTMRSGIPRFEREFRNGSRLILTFPDGSEPDWAVSLNGSSEAMGRLVTCMRSHGAEPSQPFGGTPPAQPSQPNQPTQPFSTPGPSAPAPGGPSGKGAPGPQAPPVRGQPIGY